MEGREAGSCTEVGEELGDSISHWVLWAGGCSSPTACNVLALGGLTGALRMWLHAWWMRYLMRSSISRISSHRWSSRSMESGPIFSCSLPLCPPSLPSTALSQPPPQETALRVHPAPALSLGHYGWRAHRAYWFLRQPAAPRRIRLHIPPHPWCLVAPFAPRPRRHR